MYRAMVPPSTMLQAVGNQRTNSPSSVSARMQPPRSNDPNTATAGRTEFRQYPPNVAAGGHCYVQTGTYPPELLHLMGTEMPPLRRASGYDNMQNHNHGGPVGSLMTNWHRRGVPATNNPPPNMPPAIQSNFRQHEYSNGAMNKKQTWNNNNNYNNNNNNNNNNKVNKRNIGVREGPTKNETPNCDSGFNSRSATPSKHRGDGSQNESSDDRESVSSSVGQGIKRLNEVPKNCATANNVNVTVQDGSRTSSTSQQTFHPNERNRPNLNNNCNAPRTQGQNYQGKKRYHSGRNSPPPQRTEKGRRFTNLAMTAYGMQQRPAIAPDRFLARSHLLHICAAPNDLNTATGWNELSCEIWYKFVANQQTEATYRNKMVLWKCLYIYIKSTFPKYGLFLVGSTMNGFGSDNSDVDLCLLIRQTDGIQRNEAIAHLVHLQKCLRNVDFVEDLDLIKAKVPILKFRDYVRELDVDLNCNNFVGVRNTHLLYCYSRIDWRVRPLVVVVKLWAQSQNINNAKNMTISSYSLVLMVLHFLQCGVYPSVLPCLHSMYPGKFSPNSDIHGIDIHEELKLNILPKNRQPLGELLFEFFKYYAMFDYSKFAISVRLARKIPIEECRRAISYKNDPYDWKYLCIEEPFDLTNTARSVYDYTVFSHIKQIIVESYQILKETRELSSIFAKPEPQESNAYAPFSH